MDLQTCQRKDIEQNLNSVQMDLDETYLGQVALPLGQEYLIACSNVGDEAEYLTHSLLRTPEQL